MAFRLCSVQPLSLTLVELPNSEPVPIVGSFPSSLIKHGFSIHASAMLRCGSSSVLVRDEELVSLFLLLQTTIFAWPPQS